MILRALCSSCNAPCARNHGSRRIVERCDSKNTTVPTSKSHIFTTVKDNQTSVKILVLQGDSEEATQNDLLGEFILTGLRAAKAGEIEVSVSFDISADGMVSVSAKDLETGTEQAITVTATSGLSPEEVEAMMKENEDYLVARRSSEVEPSGSKFSARSSRSSGSSEGSTTIGRL